jgi:hypothetical protein
MQFTPATALVGGLTLGIAATAKYAITGRILGISGALKGLVQNNITSWRILFLGGMVGGAVVAKAITPQAFDLLPSTFTVSSVYLGPWNESQAFVAAHWHPHQMSVVNGSSRCLQHLILIDP